MGWHDWLLRIKGVGTAPAELLAILVPFFLVVIIIALDKCSRKQANRYESQDNMTGEFVLTLVHGTWGRGILCPSGDALWTNDASKLCILLRKHLGQNTIFRRFRWSGANSHTGRAKAAKELRHYLSNNLKRWPQAKHFVIAHSHGGNVALYAMADSDLLERISGIACLATPFISVRKRDMGSDPTETLTLAVLVISIVSTSVLLKDREAHLLLSSRLIELVAYVVGNLLFLGMVALVFSFIRKIGIAFANELRDQLSPPLPEKDQLLIIRSPADEASGLLSTFQFISEVTVRLFLLAQSQYVIFERVVIGFRNHKVRVFIIGLCAFVISLVSLFYLSPDAIGLFVGFVSFIVFVESVLFLEGPRAVTIQIHTVLALFLWLVVAMLSVILVIPFGWQAAVANVFLDVTVDTTPTGTWEIHLINPPTSIDLREPVPPLIHKVYENHYALEELVKWIKQRGLQVPRMPQ